VVRVIRVAAQHSIGDLYWDDRVITPQSLRKAPVSCGKEKVDETEQETPRLKVIFEALRGLPPELRVIPFAAGNSDLTAGDVELLERNGILLREPDGYYMPEMFRHGLGFVLPRGARPKVLALARRARSGA
jgi:hypothetical protein